MKRMCRNIDAIAASQITGLEFIEKKGDFTGEPGDWLSNCVHVSSLGGIGWRGEPANCLRGVYFSYVTQD